jgi:hypothetical protein
MEVSLASLPHLQHIYLKLLVKLIVNYLTVNKIKKNLGPQIRLQRHWNNPAAPCMFSNQGW